MSITIEMLGGPHDGQAWQKADEDVADIGTVTFGADGKNYIVMDAVPSETRESVVLAVWSTRRPVTAA